MERLTERSLDYCTQLCSDEDAISCAFYKGEQEEKCWRANMYDRLAVDEDTGLSPEEIKALQEGYDCQYLSLDFLLNSLKGVPNERLREIIKAEQEGRIVVLPCKESPVWIVEEATHDCDTVPDKDCMSRPDCEGCPALKSYVRRLDEFYYTREEAEKALKGVSDDA